MANPNWATLPNSAGESHEDIEGNPFGPPQPAPQSTESPAMRVPLAQWPPQTAPPQRGDVDVTPPQAPKSSQQPSVEPAAKPRANIAVTGQPVGPHLFCRTATAPLSSPLLSLSDSHAEDSAGRVSTKCESAASYARSQPRCVICGRRSRRTQPQPLMRFLCHVDVSDTRCRYLVGC